MPSNVLQFSQRLSVAEIEGDNKQHQVPVAKSSAASRVDQGMYK